MLVPEAEPTLGDWRREHTWDGAHGMPAHVTLLYPFVDAEALGPGGAIDGAAAAPARFSAFAVEFARVGRFAGPGGGCSGSPPSRPRRSRR